MSGENLHFDAVVIGAGANGAAAAFHLTRRHLKVLLLEQFELGHEQGSSHGDSRIIRLSYEHPDFTLLARAAFSAWSEIERLSGERVYYRTGGLDLARPDNPQWRACQASLAATGVAHEILAAREIAARFPQFAVAPDSLGLWQADAGFLHAAKAVRVMTQLAQKQGATLMERTPVVALKKSTPDGK